MGALRIGVTLATLCVARIALAQPAPAAPQDPYAPDTTLDEHIAAELVDRAQQLLDDKQYQDAKQLAVEALVKSPTGPSADRARGIIKTVNTHLNIPEDPPPTPPSETPPVVDLTPIKDPTTFDPSKDAPPQQDVPPATTSDHRVLAATIHGALYGAFLGGLVTSDENGTNPIGVVVGGAAIGALARVVAPKSGWDEAQIRTVGSLNTWGGVVGGLFGAAVTGAGDGSPTGTGILLGASIGATVGGVAGGVLATKQRFTSGDIALVDTFAGIGTFGGFTLGMIMQPAQPEAYAVNAIIGASAGVVVGMVAGPQTNTTPRRMLRVAGLAAAGGALPFLLYAGIYTSSSSADERVVGLLSSAGLVGGAWLGFRLTRGMDEGKDVQTRAQPIAPPPVALTNDRAFAFPVAFGSF